MDMRLSLLEPDTNQINLNKHGMSFSIKIDFLWIIEIVYI